MQTYRDAAAFLRRAEPFLVSQELANGLILGVTIRLRDQPEWIQSPPYLATVDTDSGDLALAAAMTPPGQILIAAVPAVPKAALVALADDLRKNGWSVSGVSAVSELSQRFAEAWTSLTGQAQQVSMRMRAYELRQVIAPAVPPPGQMRLAEPADLETIHRWHVDFMRESLHEEQEENSRENAARKIRAGDVYAWDDNGLASMSVKTRPTPTGIWIGGVFTPPERRGRGYASALVAAQSQHLLDTGKQFCALFTDIDYPTSNSIYQKIGYRPVLDFQVIRFS